MFIHIGNKKIISDQIVIGIFNRETLEKSGLNEKYLDEVKDDTKTIIVDIYDEVIISNVSSFTLIKRDAIEKKDFVWRKSNG